MKSSSRRRSGTRHSSAPFRTVLEGGVRTARDLPYAAFRAYVSSVDVRSTRGGTAESERLNKVVPLEALGELVADGDSVAVGGGWFSNHPMAAVRQLLRAGRRDLHAYTV